MVTNPTAIEDSLDQFLKANPFYPCCLFVHENIAVLKAAAAQLQIYGWPFLDLNTLLAQILAASAPQRRSTLAIHSFETKIKQNRQSSLICTGIDILFEPSLKLDPFRLFRDTSRQQQTRLIILWPGEYKGSTLSYATPNHSHYRTWSQPDLQFIIQLH